MNNITARRLLLVAVALVPIAVTAGIVVASDGDPQSGVAERDVAQPYYAFVGDDPPAGARSYAPPRDFATDVPRGLEAGSYRELVTPALGNGERARVFTGVRSDNGRKCLGMRTRHVIAMSCAVELLPDGVMHVQETTYRRDRYLSGVVADSVARVVVVDVAGVATDVAIRNGAFLFEGRRAAKATAFGAKGEVLASTNL